MAEEDFDISGLAAYMHMLPTQISRLADRGKLPGRRVGGEWRFSRAEIHHWLEDRIGLSDDEQLAKMESNLERTDLSGNGEISIAALLPVEVIAGTTWPASMATLKTTICALALPVRASAASAAR